MDQQEIHPAVKILKKEAFGYDEPAITRVARRGEAYQILVGTVMSSQTKDEVTWPATQRLLKLAKLPEQMVKLPVRLIGKTIKPVSFYRNKARFIKELSYKILRDYDGRVPDSMEELLKLKGVGRKTANLTLILAFGKPGICVDTHVHKIVNRWGYVKTRTPEQTEFALRKKLPKKYWNIINELLVRFGQNVCTPVSPHCSVCSIRKYCDRVGIVKSR